jgi:uncharacterized protein (UPF0332 family)
VSLKDWANNGWLVEHRTSRQEISDLLSVADRDLQNCAMKGLSEDWQLAIAYNSVLQSATAALAACGYRVARGAHHYRVIQSLALTIGVDAIQVSRLDAFRKKRNISDYERAGIVSEAEAREIIEMARMMRKTVEDWLKQNHPNLLPT